MEKKAALGIMLALLLAIVVMVTFNMAFAQVDYFVDVDLAYLAAHPEEFFSPSVWIRTRGTVKYYMKIPEFPGDFFLEVPGQPYVGIWVDVGGLPWPTENWFVIIEGELSPLHRYILDTFDWRLGGDIDWDGYIGPIDLSMFAAAYGKQAGDPEYNPYADLEYDKYIGPIDLSIFAANYGKHI